MYRTWALVPNFGTLEKFFLLYFSFTYLYKSHQIQFRCAFSVGVLDKPPLSAPAAPSQTP